MNPSQKRIVSEICIFKRSKISAKEHKRKASILLQQAREEKMKRIERINDSNRAVALCGKSLPISITVEDFYETKMPVDMIRTIAKARRVYFFDLTKRQLCENIVRDVQSEYLIRMLPVFFARFLSKENVMLIRAFVNIF